MRKNPLLVLNTIDSLSEKVEVIDTHLRAAEQLKEIELATAEMASGMTKKQKAQVVVPVTPKDPIGRNEKCPCGSGKKYKKCCLTK